MTPADTAPPPHPTTPARGAIVAASPFAARAGRDMLDAGGNAADAAVAVAAALCVVDCANCGLGGFGGFALVDRGGASGAVQVNFNAHVPRRFDAGANASQRPGLRVLAPAVLAGLDALHRRFGRLARADVWAPAIALARDGFVVGESLAAALRWASRKHPGLNDAFRAAFFRDGEPLPSHEWLRQPRLAQTLQEVARDGAAVMRAGAVPDSIRRTVAEAGGRLDAEDFASLDAEVSDAAMARYERAEIAMAHPDQCGGGILVAALRSLEQRDLGADRHERYVRAMGEAFTHAWRERAARFAPLSPRPAQTTHLCTADADGMLVSMTFTHGPSWFGSGLLDADSGMVLNTGARIFARRVEDGAVVAQPNITPVVMRHGDVRYAIGSPGGFHIPAIVAQAIVDLAHYGSAPESVLGKPRMSADAAGLIAAEERLFSAFPTLVGRRICVEEYYGPAGMIVCRGGESTGFCDPRFDGAHAEQRP